MNKTILGIAVALGVGVASAFAIPTTLGVDFRSAAWQAATGKSRYSTGNIEVAAAFPLGSTLTSSAISGLGISAPPLQRTLDILDVTFSLRSGNGLTRAWVTNLFSGTLEIGTLVLDTTKGLEVFTFSGLHTRGKDPHRDVYSSFGNAYNVLNAHFLTVNPLRVVGVKNCSVAGFSSSVPDGGTTLALLGIGLISLTMLRRKFAF
jgi:hypothetical protein